MTVSGNFLLHESEMTPSEIFKFIFWGLSSLQFWQLQMICWTLLSSLVQNPCMKGIYVWVLPIISSFHTRSVWICGLLLHPNIFERHSLSISRCGHSGRWAFIAMTDESFQTGLGYLFWCRANILVNITYTLYVICYMVSRQITLFCNECVI